MSGTTGLVMAGGDGERMKQSGISRPKPLVPVAGRSLLERAVFWQIDAGVKEVFVSVRDDQHEVQAAIERLSRQVNGVPVRVLTETEPQGNAGALLSCNAECERIMLSFADNVWDMEGARILDYHDERKPDATLAVQQTTVAFPYGVVAVRNGEITGYTEKPTVSRLIASGYAVFERGCLGGLSPAPPIGLADVVQELLATGGTIAAFDHDSTWVDVNSRDDVRRAERLALHGAEQLVDLPIATPRTSTGSAS